MLIIAVIALVMFAVFLRAHSKHKSPAKAAISNMVLGVLSLALFAPIVSAAVNVYTVFVALTLGIPGTALVVLGSIVFG
jgi:hypothetical protein